MNDQANEKEKQKVGKSHLITAQIIMGGTCLISELHG